MRRGGPGGLRTDHKGKIVFPGSGLIFFLWLPIVMFCKLFVCLVVYRQLGIFVNRKIIFCSLLVPEGS